MSFKQFYLSETKIPKSRISKIRDILFASFLKFKNSYADKNPQYFDKPFYIFNQIFNAYPDRFKSMNTPLTILGYGASRGVFLIDNIVCKVNIKPEDANKIELAVIRKVNSKPLGKYFISPLLGVDSILGQKILFFPKCEEIVDINELSQEQKLHLSLVRKLFLDTRKLDNVMKFGGGIVCVDMETDSTSAIDNIISEPEYIQLKDSEYWKNWMELIDSY